MSFFALYDNYSAGKEDQWDEELRGDWILSGTIAAHGTDSHPSIYQAWLNAVMSWFILFIYVIIHIRSKDIVQNLQRFVISPADFTILISEIPQNATKEDIWAWVEENGTPQGMDTVEIHHITLVYDSRKFRECELQYNKWRSAYQIAPEEGTILQASKNKCKLKMIEYHNLLKELEKDVENGKIPFTGYAFVTFNFEHDVATTLDLLRGSKVLQAMQKKLRHLFCCYVPRAKNPLLGKNVIVKMPQQPQDIVWGNLCGKESQFKIRFATGCATFGLLAICFCVVYASALWKQYLIQEQSSDKDASLEAENTLRVLTLIPALVINFMNVVLTMTIRYFTNFEKFDTVTDYNSALAIKMTIAMTMSTAFVANTVYIDDWYGQASLIAEVSSIIIISAIIHPFMSFFDAFYLKKRIKQCIEKRKAENSKLTQQEAHMLFQGPQRDMAARSAYFIKSYLLVMVYGCIIPIAFPITLVSFIVEYWIDKYLLLRRNCHPPIIGKNLIKIISRFIPIGVFLNCLFSMIFHYEYNSETLTATSTGLIVSFTFLVLPWQRVMKLRSILKKAHVVQFTSLKSLKKNDIPCSYEEYRHSFMKDYDRLNPIGARKAIQEWLQHVKSKSESESVGQAMRSAYGISRTVLRQINDVLEGEGDVPDWINLRRLQDVELQRGKTAQIAQYSNNANDAFQVSRVRRFSCFK